jgi:arsenate reductase
VGAIDTSSVDVVVTLCAEEICPVFLENAYRVHWGLPDPASVDGNDEEKQDVFRLVRDELRERLAYLWSA